jgi:hypothetical protein
MFRCMSDERDQHAHPRNDRFRFTFKRRFRRAEVFENVIGSQIMGDRNMVYMLTVDGPVTRSVPLKGRRVLIEPMP